MNKIYFFQRVLLEKYFFLLNSCYGNKIWHYIYFDIDDNIKIQYKTRFINKLFKKYWFHFFHNNNCNNFSLYFNSEDWDYLWIAKDNNLSDLYHNIFNWIYNNLWESILKNILRRKKIKTEFWKVILTTRKNYIQYNWIYFKFPCEKRYIDEISNSSCPEFIKDWDKKYAFNFNWFYDLIVKYYEDISKYKYTEQFIKSNIIKIISYLLFLKDIEEFRTEKFENIDKKILSKINFNEIKFYNNENIENNIKTDFYWIAKKQIEQIHKKLKNFIEISYYDKYFNLLKESWIFNIINENDFNELIEIVRKEKLKNFMNSIWIILKWKQLEKEYKYMSIIFRFLYFNEFENEDDFEYTKRLFIQKIYDLEIDKNIEIIS